MSKPGIPLIPTQAKIGEKYDPAMAITDQAEADGYFEALVAHAMSFGLSRESAEAQERHNLGYYAGYYDSETRERVERLYKCAHPFFGPIAVNGPPTPETAFNIGQAIGSAMKDRKVDAPRVTP